MLLLGFIINCQPKKKQRKIKMTNCNREIKKNKKYVTLKYWFEIDTEPKSDRTPDLRYTDQKEGWRKVKVTQEESLIIIKNNTLKRVTISS